jgi:hypothetical protein
MTRDVDALLAQLNPFPEPEAAVDRDRRAALLRDILTMPVPPPARRRRPVVRRLAVTVAAVAAATAAVSALLLAGGEQTGAPPRFAVLTALAQDLDEPGRILHTLERSGDHEEESWTLLDDPRYERFRIRTGSGYEEVAITPTTSSDYQRRTNTVTVVRYGPEHAGDGSGPVGELPVEQLARDVAAGRIRVEERVEIRGRWALKVRTNDDIWYIAEDAPVLLRRERELPNGRIVRADFVAFEILPATPENRRLLQLQAPADAKRRTVQAPEMP